jgi:hypothetical protein
MAGTQENASTRIVVPDLGGEVADDVGLVAAPERGGALLAEDAGEGVGDAPVGPREGAPPQHLALVLQQKLDALHRRGPRLGHHGGRAAHGEVRHHTRRRPRGPRRRPLLLSLARRYGRRAHWCRCTVIRLYFFSSSIFFFLSKFSLFE